MIPLRQQMIDATRQRGFLVRTYESYLGAVRGLARYFHEPPGRLETRSKSDMIYLHFLTIIDDVIIIDTKLVSVWTC